MPIIRSTEKTFHGKIELNNLFYDLMTPHPYHMLEDEKISWEAKGILSFILCHGGEVDIPDEIIEELINSNYLVEVSE